MSAYIFVFLNDRPTPELYTLSLHDALPICREALEVRAELRVEGFVGLDLGRSREARAGLRERPSLSDLAILRGLRSEEHTSELQSPMYLVCRLLLEKKNERNPTTMRVLRSRSTASCLLTSLFF